MLYKYKNALHHVSREKWIKSSRHRQIRSHWRPRSLAKTVGSQPFPDRTGGSRQAGWDPAVPRPGCFHPGRSLARTAGIDGIRLFPEQNGRDGRDPVVLRTERPDPAQLDEIWPGSDPSPTRSVIGVVVQSETVWISGGSGSELCGRRGLFLAV
jgi:hypothetical protein